MARETLHAITQSANASNDTCHFDFSMVHTSYMTTSIGGVMNLLIFFVGALLGILAGGALCVRYLRSAIADDISPQLRRMHADIDPQLRRMQNQLDNIESAVNLAMASRYAELSQVPWPPAIPAPRTNDP